MGGQRRLPLIDVPNPCPMSWSAMTGTHIVRTCQECGRPIHNLSAMGAAEAEALLKSSESERLCVTFSRNANGDISTEDEQRRRRVSTWPTMSIAALFAFLGLWQPSSAQERQATLRGTVRDPENHRVEMGDVRAFSQESDATFETQTAKNGTYKLALPPGRYLIGFSNGLEHCPVYSVTVRAGHTTRINVRLRAWVLGEVVYKGDCHNYRGR